MIQPLFLVGARGCGKTTIGRALAEALGYDFVDTDSHLLNSTGKSGDESCRLQSVDAVLAPE